MPHKRREPQQTGGSENTRHLIHEGSLGLDLEKRLTSIIKQLKEQKQAIIKHKTKIYAEARYFAFKIGHERC